MLNRFAQFIRKYSFFSVVLALGSMGITLAILDRWTLSNALFAFIALLALVIAAKRSLDTLRHGYYGIYMLPILGIVTALFIKDFETAAALGFIISLEQTLTDMVLKTKSNSASLNAARHAPFVRFLDKASLPLSVMVFLIAGGVWLATRDTGRFLEVIASASTSPLVLTAPIIMIAGTRNLKRTGINISSAAIIERAFEVKTVLLKKTGVLTSSKLEVSSVVAYGNFTKEHVTRIASALATGSDHTTAQAITSYANTKQKVNSAKHTQETLGEGISGRMKGVAFHMGRLSYLERLGISGPGQATKIKKPVVFIAEGATVIGAIEFNDSLLPGANKLARKLHKLGIKTIELVSGTSEKSTQSVAKSAAISTAYGDMTTSSIIRLFDDKKRPIAFVGSDNSDEPAATAADLSIATVPLAGFDISIEDYTPGVLVQAFKIAKRTFKLARALSLIGLVAVLGVLVIASTGILQPAQAVLLNGVITMLSIVLGPKFINWSKAH